MSLEGIGATAALPGDPAPWVIIMTLDDAEDTAAANLRRAGYRVYLPQYRKLLWPHGSERRGVPTMRPLLPGYLFVHDWFGWPNRRMAGVAGIVRATGGGNVEMSDRDIMLIWAREREGRFDDSIPRPRVKRTDIAAGDVTEFGLLDDRISAVLGELTDSGKAVVTAMFFNRDIPVTLAAERLRAI